MKSIENRPHKIPKSLKKNGQCERKMVLPAGTQVQAIAANAGFPRGIARTQGVSPEKFSKKIVVVEGGEPEIQPTRLLTG